MRRLLILIPLALAGCDDAPVAKPAAPSRDVIGKRTQVVKDAPTEIRSGAAVPAPARPIARDPFTLAGNVYVSAIGQTSINNIKHAVDLYHAEKGEYPKDYRQFMAEIIEANNIALPTLPSYQEYGYDPATHRLTVIEYPDRKATGPR